MIYVGGKARGREGEICGLGRERWICQIMKRNEEARALVNVSFTFASGVCWKSI
jgi:hypothetical protein